MIIVSTINNATLTLNTNNETLKDILESSEVVNFFNAVSTDIIDAVESVNDMDADTLRSAFGSLLVEEDMKIEVALEGEEAEESAPSTVGKAFIARGGGMGQKEVAIVAGHTTVNDVLTQSVADYFATTIEGLKNLNISVNDISGSLNTTLNDGDVVTLEVRKAGDKGSSYSIDLIDSEGEVREYEFDDEDIAIEDVAEEVIGELLNDCAEVVEVDGSEIPSSFYDAIMQDAAVNHDSITFDSAFIAADHDEEITGCDNCTCTSCGANTNASILEGPAVGTAGKVVLKSAGGLTSIEIPVVSGVTTVRQVVTSTKAMNAFAMSEEQALGLTASINEQTVDFNDKVTVGDVIYLAARKAGDKGNC